VSLPEHLQKLVDQTEAALPGQKTPEFERIREGIFSVQVCTSLTDDEATARVNELPSGTTGGWTLTADPDAQPVPCDDKPNTHRHLLFDA
jgi:hypothetical protein